MVDHDVVRFYITVHDALRVAKVKSLQDLKHVEANVKVVEALVQLAEIGIASIYKLSNNRRCLRQWVPYNINEIDNIRSTLKRLQYLDLTSNLVLLNYAQHL